MGAAGFLADEAVAWTFAYADLTVLSAIPFPEVRPAGVNGRGPADIEVVLSANLEARTNLEMAYSWRIGVDAGSPVLGSTGAGRLLRFPGLADFTISEDGKRVAVWPAPETNPETLRHLLLDHVFPRLLAHRGRLVLHSGAVRVGESAIAFLGPSGCGKSTLTAGFHEAGLPLLSDDGVVLTPGDGCTWVLPTYPSLRLWPDAVAGLFSRAPALAPMAHYSSKQRVGLGDGEESGRTPLTLAALYVLASESGADAQAIGLTSLSPRDACMEIIRNSFQLDVTDRRRAAEALDAAGDISQHVPAFRLSFPREFARLPDVRAAILGQRDLWASGPAEPSPPGRHDGQDDRL